MVHSFSGKGNPYDNACIESFHSVLKKEEIYTTTYYTFEEAKTALFEYIESFYNRKRRTVLLITRHHNGLKTKLWQLKKQSSPYIG